MASKENSQSKSRVVQLFMLSLILCSLAVYAGSIVEFGINAFDGKDFIENDFIAVAIGSSHGIALKADGSIVGWGNNFGGKATPPAGNDFVAIAAGQDQSLALKNDGSIVGWGGSAPPAGNDFVAIAVGDMHGLALKADGSIVGWGAGSGEGGWFDFGQATPPAGNDFVTIAAGGMHSLALKADGSIVGWGNGSTPPAGTDFVAIAAGGGHDLALKADGSIVGWGRDDYGQAIPPAGNDYVAIVASSNHSLALKAEGSVVGWGDDEHGQATPPAGNNFVAIAAGMFRGFALKSDGSIVGWGADFNNVLLPAIGNDFTAIATGSGDSYHSLALKADGSIVGWGEDIYGQATPPAGNDFVAVAADGMHSLALKADGSIVGWGAGDETGQGEPWMNYGQAIPPDGNDFVAVAAGGGHSLALKVDGSIVGWGYDGSGQATPPAGNDYVAIVARASYSLALKADGSIVGWGFDGYGQATPPAGNDYVAIVAGMFHGLAIKADGSIAGWGFDIFGQSTPPAGNNFVAVAAGDVNSLAIKTDGTIIGWGENTYGESTPPAGSDFVAIAGSSTHSLALRSFGVETPAGEDVIVEPADPNTGAYAALTFDNVIEPGHTWLTVSEPDPLQIPPEGFLVGDPPKVFDIGTSSVFEGNIIIEIDYSGISYENELGLKLFHYEDANWVDVTTSVDTVNDIIYGEVSSLSDFAIFASANQSPVAVCRDVTVYPDYACGADVQAIDVNDVSSDPDGDPITFTLDPAGPYDVGTHEVTLIVSDGTDNDECTSMITVLMPECTYDGETLLSTEGQATVDTTLIVNLRDAQGNVIDVNDVEVTFVLNADGVAGIEISAYSLNGIVEAPIALEPAIYTIDMYVACDTSQTPAESAYIVVYNPEGGFATGGGWIVPQDDGLNTYPNARANFGFNAKYKKDEPTGHIEFRYSDGYIDLKSDSIEQFVITGGKMAQFKGWATVNGLSENWFFAKAIDNGEPGTEDTFEIKIWQPGQDIEGDPAERAGGVLEGGNIVVHTKDK